MKKIVSALILAGLVGAPGVVMAEEAASPHTLSANVGMYSNYVFRGISQTGGDPALQGGLDYTHSSGFYLGTWGSNVGWLEDFQGYNSGNVEIDVYGGFRGGIGETGLTFDVGAIQYMFPGDKGAVTEADTTEIYGAVGWKWFTAKYSYYLSKQVFGFADAKGSDYLGISASVPVGETGLTAGASWGTFSFDNNSAQDYDDWKVSLAYDMGKLSDVTSGVTVGVAYTDTNADKSGVWTDLNGEYLGDATTTVWISKAF
ncbi:MAG: TorF family putative porin [Gammaproteobacteria bacterium]|nr:TorF family putative porin [Gammaproteobacteria bacterium]